MDLNLTLGPTFILNLSSTSELDDYRFHKILMILHWQMVSKILRFQLFFLTLRIKVLQTFVAHCIA
jgi:hypothetical protein